MIANISIVLDKCNIQIILLLEIHPFLIGLFIIYTIQSILNPIVPLRDLPQETPFRKPSYPRDDDLVNTVLPSENEMV